MSRSAATGHTQIDATVLSHLHALQRLPRGAALASQRMPEAGVSSPERGITQIVSKWNPLSPLRQPYPLCFIDDSIFLSLSNT